VYSRQTHEIVVLSTKSQTTIALLGRDGVIVIGCELPYQLQRVMASRGVSHIDHLILPNQSTYRQNLRDLLAYVSVSAVHVSSQTLQNGLVTDLSEQVEQLSLSSHVTLGAMSVAAAEDFRRFTITVQGKSYDYCLNDPDFSAKQAQIVASCGVKDAKGAVILGESSCIVDDIALVRIRKGKTTLYQPRMLLG
jgi:hypothetical protein